MESKAIWFCFLLLFVAFLPRQIDAFSFNIKPVGSTKVTATPGELITYNAHLTISDSTPLSFHVSLPYFQTPIINVEKIEVLGVGRHLDTSYAIYSFFKEDANRFQSRSQSSVDFGNVTRNMSAVGAGNDVVVQVQARLLKHANVTAGAVFWLYFGMHYQNDAVWVIGKSIKADLKPGPAKLAVSIKMPEGITPLMSKFKFKVDIVHLPDSKSSASDLVITLSTPSYLTSPVVTTQVASPAYTVAGTNDITLTFSEEFKVGQQAQLLIEMTYSGSEKGKFVGGNVYGSFQYKTKDENNCERTVEKKEEIQMGFKLYAEKDTCDETLGFANGEILEASSAMLPCCFPKYASMVAGYHQFAWRPWSNAGLRLADEYVQVNFDKKATVNTILTHGLAKTGQFLRSFYVSYSQNGVHWKYVTHMGKKKEFEANVNDVDKVIILLPTPVTAWFLRMHVVKRSPAGVALKLKMCGCKDAVATKPYEAYQRGFLANDVVLALCNVHPDKTQAKSNCYSSLDKGAKWEAIHPSVVNILGLNTATGEFYGLGVTSDDTPVYMVGTSSESFRGITEADWTAAKSACILPTVIPMYPAHGNIRHQVTGASVTTSAGVTYFASPEGLLKTESGVTKMLASWTEYKSE